MLRVVRFELTQNYGLADRCDELRDKSVTRSGVTVAISMPSFSSACVVPRGNRRDQWHFVWKNVAGEDCGAL